MTDPLTARPFEIADGAIFRADGGERTKLGRRLARLPGMRSILALHAVKHAAAAVRLGRLVRETPRFVANDLRSATGMRAYTMKADDATVLLRHGMSDIWTFNELFLLELYAPPAPVRAILGGTRAPVILDLGANIGLFGLDALSRYPGASITAYEPDPENARIHRELIARNPEALRRWRLVQACAGASTGTVSFVPGRGTVSRIVEPDAEGAVDLAMHDVLEIFGSACLVKMDIEGGEWDLLADHRLSSARAVVLEYHPANCPASDPHATARRLLEDQGFAVLPIFENPDGVGMLWAYHPPS